MKIILYTTHTCPRCEVLKKKLRDKKIKFEEIDDLDTLRDMGLTEVPVIDITDGQQTWRGDFNAARKWIDEWER